MNTTFEKNLRDVKAAEDEQRQSIYKEMSAKERKLNKAMEEARRECKSYEEDQTLYLKEEKGKVSLYSQASYLKRWKAKRKIMSG